MTYGIGCKCIGSLCIFFGTSCLAFNINRDIENRLKQLQELYGLLLQLKNEIKYLYNVLPDCFDHLSQREEPFSEWCKHLSDKLMKCDKEDFTNIWESELNWLHLHSALDRQDIMPLYDLGSQLVDVDVTIKIQSIDYVLLHLEKRKNDYEKIIMQKKKMCFSMCAFLGALTLIILL